MTQDMYVRLFADCFQQCPFHFFAGNIFMMQYPEFAMATFPSQCIITIFIFVMASGYLVLSTVSKGETSSTIYNKVTQKLQNAAEEIRQTPRWRHLVSGCADYTS